MNRERQRNFSISPPSILALNWRFDFVCTIKLLEPQRVVISIEDDTIGSVELCTANPGENWKIWLFVWQQCYLLALNYAVVANTQDFRKMQQLNRGPIAASE